jgi:hypothetical protein
MAYFTISNGLRGCYMPDSIGVFQFSTRRELKAHLMTEMSYLTGEKPFNKRDVAHIAAIAWRQAKRKEFYSLPYCMPCGAGYGLFISATNRAEYLESLDNDA